MTSRGEFRNGKEVSLMRNRSLAVLGMLLVPIAVALWGCSNGGLSGAQIDNLRPSVEMSNAPIEGDTTFYSVRINWFASDPDGQVTHYLYAEDPQPGQDTTWIETSSSEITLFWRSPGPDDPLPPIDRPVTSRGYHTFVLKAVDNEGLTSAPIYRSFTSKTVAPSTTVIRPQPTNQQAVSVTPSVTIDWLGTDPDGEISQRPVRYAFILVPASDINPDQPEGITELELQEYFGSFADEGFASWESVSGDTTSKFYEGLTPGTRYYFAIVAFDEAGAYEARFNLSFNLLQLRPTLNKLGPRITVFNEFFQRTQTTGGISLAPSRIIRFEFPADSPITFNWFAEPPIGAVINGYRWCVDIENQDIVNETPRDGEDDIRHWSTWSLNETAATIGPFAGSLDSTVVHYFYLEARDNLGFVSLFTIQLTIVKPSFERPLLNIDDMYGTTSSNPFRPVGSYPMEAEADSFYYAIGGVPDEIGAPGALSEPGIFSEFESDTLDYRFFQEEGIPLSRLAQYKVVVWYTDGTSSSRTQPKFGSLNPGTAIWYVNSVGKLNTLAVYLRQATADGGKAWILGDGMTTAIANGYFTRIGSGQARLPYTSGENPRTDILRIGNFLFDFCHLQSELNTAGTVSSPTLSIAQRLKSAIPYLPEFACAPGQNPLPDRTCDPRIGPSAAKTAIKWSGLPRLTLRNYRGSIGADQVLGPPNLTWVITRPLFVTEGAGATFRSVMDTLYLNQAREYDPNSTRIPPSDGFPNAVHYYGSQHGEVVWMGFPLYFFERDQARLVVHKVLTNFNLTPATPDKKGAHPFDLGSPRIIADGEYGTEFVDTRRKSQ